LSGFITLSGDTCERQVWMRVHHMRQTITLNPYPIHQVYITSVNVDMMRYMRHGIKTLRLTLPSHLVNIWYYHFTYITGHHLSSHHPDIPVSSHVSSTCITSLAHDHALCRSRMCTYKWPPHQHHGYHPILAICICGYDGTLIPYMLDMHKCAVHVDGYIMWFISVWMRMWLRACSWYMPCQYIHVPMFPCFHVFPCFPDVSLFCSFSPCTNTLFHHQLMTPLNGILHYITSHQ
jgi:hypothetical protein